MENINLNGLLKKTKKTVLSEKESKQILKEYGVPVVNETVALNIDEAITEAKKIGFPVVLKGFGSTLWHKTELGLVHLNLANSDDIRNACFLISEKAGNELQGYLLQPQIEGKREFVAGLFHDPQFGPVVMFGMGGIFTEAFSDVTFRIAPLTEKDASEMLEELKAKALLGNFRGEKAVDRKQLIGILTGLSSLGMEQPDILEVDINPIIATPDGRVIAVDALVAKGKKENNDRFLPPVDPHLLKGFFNPKSVAFVGASSSMGKWGHRMLVNTISGGFDGKIYLVNSKGNPIAGRKVYRNVAEIPGSIDLAVVTIPVAGVMDLIPQFKEKGIKNMLLVTSGFGEAGSSGREIEKNLVAAALKAGIRIIGPNTMGMSNPHINLFCLSTVVRPRPGSIAILAQSGNMGTQLFSFAEQQDIGIRIYCGSGNEAMVTIEDYLDAFGADSATKTIILYIESVKNGRRFFKSALRVGKKKPIVLLKGGQSKAGKRAAVSHTGAMSSDSRIFDVVCKQTGIVKVEQPMDLLDLSIAFSSLPLPKGNRVAIMTLGGGWGVVTADLCSKYGLDLPELSPEITASIDKMLPPYWSKANPIDLVGEYDFSMFFTIIEELVKWDGCDAVINLGVVGRSTAFDRLGDAVLEIDPAYTSDYMDSYKKEWTSFEEKYVDHVTRLMEKYDKPVFGVGLLAEAKSEIVYRVKGNRFKGVFFPTPERTVKVFARMLEYYRFLTR